MKEPILKEVYADNGQFSHWVLINGDTGEKLWSEAPEECRAMGYPVEDSEEIKAYKEYQQDVKSLTREIDVIINGEEGAAKQASLCDLVGDIQMLADIIKMKANN